VVSPETRYATLDGLRIAFQVFGDGPPDVLLSAGSFSHTDVVWEEPGAALFLRRFGSFSRVIRLDVLGAAGSDRLPAGMERPEFGAQLDAVLDEVGTERIDIVASIDAGPGSLRYAAANPQRVGHLVLVNSTARWRYAEDYPIGLDPQVVEALTALIENDWGTDVLVATNAPSKSEDPEFRTWYAKFIRSIGTPTEIKPIVGAVVTQDARDVLDRIQVPTLVLHRRNYAFVPFSHGEYLAEKIAGARLVELPGGDGPMFWETPDLILNEIERFLGSKVTTGSPRRRLLTVLFTDIVESTAKAGEMGDRDWTTLLDLHYQISSRAIEGSGGRVVKRTGDGILGTFEDPGAAVSAALNMRNQLAAIAVQIRTGLHTGQVEIEDGDVSGVAVHVAARVMAEAGPGVILVSRTVRDIALGSSLRFVDAGIHDLKGLPEPWQLYQVEPG
jgi:class 3 adenylate cyclase/pimeloyl-ACP methyl ester carboxylesterase